MLNLRDKLPARRPSAPGARAMVSSEPAAEAS